MNWTKLMVYAVTAAAACAVVLGVVHGVNGSFWPIMVAVIVAIYASGRSRGSCLPRRRSDR